VQGRALLTLPRARDWRGAQRPGAERRDGAIA